MNTQNNNSNKSSDFSNSNTDLTKTIIDSVETLVGSDHFETILNTVVIYPMQKISLLIIQAIRSPLEDFINNINIPKNPTNAQEIEAWTNFINRVNSNIQSEPVLIPLQMLVQNFIELLKTQGQLIFDELYPEFQPKLLKVTKDLEKRISVVLKSTATNSIRAGTAALETAMNTTPIGAIYKAATATTFSVLPLIQGITNWIAVVGQLTSATGETMKNKTTAVKQSFQKTKQKINDIQTNLSEITDGLSSLNQNMQEKTQQLQKQIPTTPSIKGGRKSRKTKKNKKKRRKKSTKKRALKKRR